MPEAHAAHSALQQETTMVSPFTITRPTGRASFESMTRSWDESPVDAFSIELTAHLALYGIWRPKWASNENDFDVEIVSFGWAGKHNIGNPYPMARTKLTVERVNDVKELIIALIEDVDARRKIVPFSSKTARFLGRIDFQDNWAWV
jgi:hypothetical protein